MFDIQHPGGEDVILEHAGRDATIVFKEVGHSDDAKSLLKHHFIGLLVHKVQYVETFKCLYNLWCDLPDLPPKSQNP